METLKNLPNILKTRAEKSPYNLAYCFYHLNGNKSSITYKELWEKSKALGLALQQHTTSDKVLMISLEPSLEYIITVYGCMLAGRTFMPTYPLFSQKDFNRLHSLVKHYQIGGLIWEPHDQKMKDIGEQLPLQAFSFSSLIKLTEHQENYFPFIPHVANPLLLQCSSGTTQYPKAVIIQNSQLISCLSNMKNIMGLTTDDIGVSWLPPYHDMGLIGCIFVALYVGFPVHFTSPRSFMVNPLRWIQMINQVRATITAAPNMAYDLAAKKFQQKPLKNVELSCLKIAINSSEMIRAPTISTFINTFSPLGLREEALKTAYGLAETTLMSSFTPRDEKLLFLDVDHENFKKGLIKPKKPDKKYLTLISSGKVLPEMSLYIVDINTDQPKATYEIGEIWVSGNSLAEGYYLNESITQAQFIRPDFQKQRCFVRTGDCGFLDEKGHLYVTGRLKDSIPTMSGVFPVEYIEEIIDKICKLDSSYGTALLLVKNPTNNDVVILKEAPLHLPYEEYAFPILKILEEEIGPTYSRVLFVKRGAIPRTTSGKIKRHAAAILVRLDLLDVLHELEV